MFWKKSKPEEPMYNIELDERRSSYRVCPNEKYPVYLELNGVSVNVIDIGAGGLAFRNTNLKEENNFHVSIGLTGRKALLNVDVHILRIDSRDICHCCFTKISDHDVESIHLYMLKVQKEEIKNRKSDM